MLVYIDNTDLRKNIDHILNVINDIAQKNSMQIGYYNREKILRIFALIDQAAKQVDTDRKRMVCIQFILKQLFDISGIEYCRGTRNFLPGEGGGGGKPFPPKNLTSCPTFYERVEK